MTTVFPRQLDSVRSDLLSNTAGAGIHAKHHDDLADGLNATQAAIRSQIFNVRHRGALGDGITDDTTAIDQAYSDWVAAGKVGYLYFPPGTYVRGPWTISDANARIFIEAGATVQQKAVANSFLIRVNAAGVVICGYGTLDGNHANNATDGALYPCIEVDAADCHVEGLTIRNAKRGIAHLDGSRARFRNLTFNSIVRNAIFSGGGIASFDDEVWSDITVVNHGSGATAGEIASGCPGLRTHADNAGTFIYRSLRANNLRVEMATVNTFIGVEVWANQNTNGSKWTDIELANVTVKNSNIGVSVDSCDANVRGVSVFEGTYGVEFAGPARGSVDDFNIDLNNRTGSRGIIVSNVNNGKVSIGIGTIRNVARFVDIGNSVQVDIGPFIGIGSASTIDGIYLTGASKIRVNGPNMIGGGNGVSFAAMEIETPGTGLDLSWTADGFTHNVYAWGSSGTFDRISIHNMNLLNIGDSYPVVNAFTGSAVWGASVRVTDCPGFNDTVDLLNNVIRASGAGAPAIAAGVGSIYQRRDGGAGTSLYVKESGTGTSGWAGK